MRIHTLAALTLACAAPLSCGDDTATSESASGSEGATSTPSTGVASQTTETSEGTTASPTQTGTGSTSNATGTSATDPSTSDPSTSSSTEDPPKLDLEAWMDIGVGEGCGGGMMGEEPEFSYIWVANSSQGTISKINTETLVEEGRYYTRPDLAGSPSRTSVNLAGDVAVANRQGGVTKVIAVHENCDEMKNGMPGLQTSSGKDDILPWGQDDCVAWHTAFPAPVNANRPAAWTSGVLNQVTCEVEDTKFWTATANTGDATSMKILRLNGDDGTVEDEVPTPDIHVGSFGAYGGAVNSENDFWFINYSPPRKLVHVDYETLEHTSWDVPAGPCSYGFTVDSQDRPWIGSFCSASLMFDPESQQWTQFPNILGYGLQEDADGIMWLATFNPPGLRGIDTETLQETKWIQLPTNSSRGCSVDFYGYVWFVDMQNSAFKVDTDAETWEVYDQLQGPYTYSDMTGWGLSLVAGGGPNG